MELTKRGIKRKCFRQCLIAFFNGYMFIFIHIHIHPGWQSQFQTKAFLQMFIKNAIFSESSWCFSASLEAKNEQRKICQETSVKSSVQRCLSTATGSIDLTCCTGNSWWKKSHNAKLSRKKTKHRRFFGNKSRGHFEVSCQKNGLASKGSNQRFFQEENIEISPPFVLGDLLFGQE